MLPDNLESRLVELLSSEISLYRQLEEYVDEELDCVQKGDMAKLLEILQQKQGVISKQQLLQEQWEQVALGLGVTEGREGPVFWSAVEHHMESQGFLSLSHLIVQIRELVTSVLAKEEHVQALLEEHISELRKEMGRLNKGKAAFHGYMKSGGAL
ncbi:MULTISPECIES: flagellar export chaperone FlgN [Aminobacterium]|jgi:DNA-binding winged helix-turn-helix (wHTH) protein|uniref:flagellar export chaperone FlgN n=1 Tax=Aminobacterium TaxID=81466 RepID=UPI0004B994C8|nr:MULTISPECIES: flagellar export chaperone FlgN [Aminobacterium]